MALRKRARHDAAPPSKGLLAAAAVVCRSHSELAKLPHVTRRISDFADFSCELWSLESVNHPKLDEASAVRLLDRLLQREWTGLNEAFRIAHCRHNVTNADEDKPLIQTWWLTKYLPLTHASVDVILQLAIQYNRTNVLDWLEQKRVLPLA